MGRARVLVTAVRQTGRMVEVFDEKIPEIESILPPQYERGITVDVTQNDPDFCFNLTSRSQ